MTSRDILGKFYIRFGALHDLDAHILTTDEIGEAINISMLSLLSDYVKVYEINEMARIALQPLVVTHECVIDASPSNDIISTESVVYTIPTDCFAVVLAQAGITYDETPAPEPEEDPTINDTIKVKPITHDYYWENINNPFKKPYRKLAWRLNYIDGHEVIPDSTYVVNLYIIRYVKNPTLFNIMTNANIELNTKEIDIIIDMAVLRSFEFLVNNGRVKGVIPSQTNEKE